MPTGKNSRCILWIERLRRSHSDSIGTGLAVAPSSRRAFLIATTWIAIASSGAAFAQSKKPPIVIGWLGSQSRAIGERNRNTFKSELAALGWRTGSELVIEERFADGDNERLPALAEELAAKKPALIVVGTITAARAAAKAAPKTPVVLIGGDAVSSGLAASYSRPGGMVTGISSVNPEISEKYLELLIHAGSNPRRVGFLVNSAAGGGFLQHKENVRRSAARFAIDARSAEIARTDEIEPALMRLAKEGIQALVVLSTAGPLATERKRVVKFALEQRWPVIGGTGWAEDGALLSYGAEISAIFRRGAYFTARILKGAKPGDLPIERPMTFELVLNMRTAKALGLAIPHAFGARVDRVIE